MEKTKPVVNNEVEEDLSEATTEEETLADEELTDDIGDNVNESTEESENQEMSEDEVLADGTSSKKSVPFDRFREASERANSAEEELANFKPIIDAVEKNPELKEQILANKVVPGESLKRFDNIEDKLKKLEQQETESALRKMMSQYPDFRKLYPEIKTILSKEETISSSYYEALVNSYLKVKKNDFLKPEVKSDAGVVNSSSSSNSQSNENEFSETERDALDLAGISMERAKVLKEKGLFNNLDNA